MSWLKNKTHQFGHFLGEEAHKTEHIAEVVVKAPVNLTEGVVTDTAHAVQDVAHGDFKGALHETGNVGAEFVEQPAAIAHAAGVDLKTVGEVGGATVGFVTGGPLGAVEGYHVGGDLGGLGDHVANHDRLTVSEVIHNAGGMALDAVGVPSAAVPFANEGLQITANAIDHHHFDIKDVTTQVGNDVSSHFGGAIAQPIGSAFGDIARDAIAGGKIDGSTVEHGVIQAGTGIASQYISNSEYGHLGSSISQSIPHGNFPVEEVSRIIPQQVEEVSRIIPQQIDEHLVNPHEYSNFGGNSFLQPIYNQHFSTDEASKIADHYLGEHFGIPQEHGHLENSFSESIHNEHFPLEQTAQIVDQHLGEHFGIPQEYDHFDHNLH